MLNILTEMHIYALSWIIYQSYILTEIAYFTLETSKLMKMEILTLLPSLANVTHVPLCAKPNRDVFMNIVDSGGK